jgi:hypothetical protein
MICGGRKFTIEFGGDTTPPGDSVCVNVCDDDTLYCGTVEFDTVTVSGDTNLDVDPLGPALPNNYGACDSLYLEFWTTAEYRGLITVCAYYSDLGIACVVEDSLVLMHYDSTNGLWYDITTDVDTLNNKICGQTPHLSQFKICYPLRGTGVRPPPNDTKLALNSNVPNPFNPSTTISFTLSSPMEVVLCVYDVTGRHLITLFDGMAIPGTTERTWHGVDKSGTLVPSGVYFYRLIAENEVLTQKMVLLK